MDSGRGSVTPFVAPGIQYGEDDRAVAGLHLAAEIAGGDIVRRDACLLVRRRARASAAAAAGMIPEDQIPIFLIGVRMGSRFAQSDPKGIAEVDNVSVNVSRALVKFSTPTNGLSWRTHGPRRAALALRSPFARFPYRPRLRLRDHSPIFPRTSAGIVAQRYVRRSAQNRDIELDILLFRIPSTPEDRSFTGRSLNNADFLPVLVRVAQV